MAPPYRSNLSSKLCHYLGAMELTGQGCSFRVTRSRRPWNNCTFELPSQHPPGEYRETINGYLTYSCQFGAAKFLADHQEDCARYGITLIDLASNDEAAVLYHEASGFDYIHLEGVADSLSTGLAIPIYHLLDPLISAAAAAGRRANVNCHKGQTRSGVVVVGRCIKQHRTGNTACS